MSASVNDKIVDVRNAARPNSARATGTRSAGGTSLACDNLAGWPTASKVHFVTYQIDSSSVQVADTQLDCYGIVSGNTIGSFTVVDGTDTGNSVNDVVEMLPTAAWGQDLADALTNQHTRTGAHTGITTDTIVVSSGTTLPAGDIATADIADSAVTTSKLNTASVTADKLGLGSTNTTVATSEASGSTSYTDLATPGPSVTITVGANGLALVVLYTWQSNSAGTAATFTSFAVSGANTSASADTKAQVYVSSGNNAALGASSVFLLTGLTAGSTTFKMQYRVDGSTGTWLNRRIAAIPL
jgi:hypothetical protein